MPSTTRRPEASTLQGETCQKVSLHMKRLMRAPRDIKQEWFHMFRLALAGCLALIAIGCGSATDASVPSPAALFEIEVSGEVFTVAVATASQAADLRARLQSGTRGVVTGSLAAGNGGFNAPWPWHLTLQSVATADMSIELCDGRPSMVSADLAYWIGTVRQFCPWGAKVVREK